MNNTIDREATDRFLAYWDKPKPTIGPFYTIFREAIKAKKMEEERVEWMASEGTDVII